ncbi:hypothetical protein [Methanoculleus sp.]|uniref:hypothetical protein n=1 Tax=Methanoculleus sp. TaxID=90427 RepID=UPI00261C64A7|nr:hypothetical protein [Methanoculleus sp.]MDI6867653.1 hypothetical protein [Methanoculleus sp.]
MKITTVTMPVSSREDALSEVVGFVLLLALIVVALSLYQVYGVPAAGRENEIAHMNQVKDRFVDYKIALDSLWVVSINTTTTAEGITLSTLFDLGTMGGSTQGGGLFFPVLAPIASGGTFSVNRSPDNLTILVNNDKKVALAPMGEVSYQSSNNYWIQQRYYYQMGGLFLEQDSGTTARLSPTISVYKVNTSNTDNPQYRLKVKIAAIQITGGHEIGGQGIARVNTRLREGVSREPFNDTSNVTIMVDAHDEKAAAAWRQVFIDAVERDGVEWGTADDARPVRIFREGKQVFMICRPEMGTEPTRIQYVDLDVIRANFKVTLQQTIVA